MFKEKNMYQYKELYTIDFREVKDFDDLHLAIKEELDFPEYCGHNLDALWDCLCDMIGSDPVIIEILGFDVIEREFDDYAEKLVKIFKRAKHYRNDRYADIIKIEIVSGDVRVEIK